ncbi:hypothetical protein C8R46DRAFT_1136582 [Mycena filopes]|nr:hypothetical protein C8R46DRAFT_1136582 [Mycena filopes]
MLYPPLTKLRPRARLKTSLKIGRLKRSSTPTQTHNLSDVLWTSLRALQESSDAFPPLKSAVGGVMALWDVAQRAKHSKADARGLALRAQEILEVIADAVPDPSTITPAMLLSIERFTILLDDSTHAVESIAFASSVSRVMHLNRNEQTLQHIQRRLDDAHADFLLASTVRLEIQQAALALKQEETRVDVKKISLIAETLAPDILFLRRIALVSTFFWQSPDASIHVASLPTP